MAFANDLAGGERAALPLSGRRLVLRSRKVGNKGGKAKRQGGEAQFCAHQMLLGCWGPTALFNRMLMLTAVIIWRERLFPNHPTVTENYDCSAAATEAAIPDGPSARFRPGSGYFCTPGDKRGDRQPVNSQSRYRPRDQWLRSGVIFHGWQGAVRAVRI